MAWIMPIWKDLWTGLLGERSRPLDFGPNLEEEENVDAVLVVHHDYEGAAVGMEQVPGWFRIQLGVMILFAFESFSPSIFHRNDWTSVNVRNCLETAIFGEKSIGDTSVPEI